MQGNSGRQFILSKLSYRGAALYTNTPIGSPPVGFLLIFLQLIEIPMQLQGIFPASELA